MTSDTDVADFAFGPKNGIKDFSKTFLALMFNVFMTFPYEPELGLTHRLIMKHSHCSFCFICGFEHLLASIEKEKLFPYFECSKSHLGADRICSFRTNIKLLRKQPLP